MIQVGTAGFSYEDWRGPFYPEDLSRADMLRYYARRFSVVELDFSYYHMPGQRTMTGLERKTPAGFQFCVKAHKSLTHEVEPGGLNEALGQFRHSLRPMLDAGKLGCILCQFPWRFRPGGEARDHLQRLAEGFSGLPCVIEFRNRDWAAAETYGLLRRLGLGYCCVDEPRLRGLMPPVAVATADTGYVRFHGRNHGKWWRHDQAWERYDYLYGEAELQPWLKKIADITAKCGRGTFVIFNNHYAGQAPRNAGMLQELMQASA